MTDFDLFHGGSDTTRGWNSERDRAHRAAQRDRARLAVAGRATDTADCRELLDMLGLLPGQDTTLD